MFIFNLGFRSLVQIVNLHQPNTRASISPPDNCSVVARWDVGDQSGFPCMPG
jgi:hypothetical protein